MDVIKAKAKEIDFCSTPLLGKIIKFSIPLMLTGVLQLLYNAADIIVVGQFAGKEAMAAVGSTGSLINLIINLFIGLSVGALASTGHWIGARNHKKVDAIVHTSILISVIAGLILAVVGFFMSKYFLVWMKTPDSVLPLSTIYLKIFFIGMPFNLLYNYGSSILRACGETKKPLYYLIFSGIINVGLNLLFVIKFKMSVSGVALATIISQALSAFLVVMCLMKRKGYGKLVLKRLRIDKKALAEIIKIGLPAGIQGTIFSLSNVLIQSSINTAGEIAMAGNAAATSIEGFVYVSMNSLSQANLTFTSQNYGAGKAKNIKLILLQTSFLVAIVGLIMGVGVYLLAKPLLWLYNPNEEVIAYGVERLLVIGTTYFICGLMEVFVGSLRGIGKSLLPMFTAIIGVCGVRIVWIYTVFARFNTLKILYLSYPISWFITALVHYICFLITSKKAFQKALTQSVIDESDSEEYSKELNLSS